MKQIEKMVSEHITQAHNTLRFDCTDIITRGIYGAEKIEAVKFLVNVFGYRFSECQEIYDRIQQGEKFIEITNELTIRNVG